ncbi:hypothetical protein [Brachybacterium kimchii]|uniref:Uncharacterized protein n=1 Tax=Brachybacterium kimchii TaxID=2942909 RepID=A0ABY4N7F4_9MICO|nr:hypothetical protein [Brachybacterium kimchii]UQN30482.1 hypothetical protein M4486_03830 [Brachybacterium kimchii]
MEKVYPSDLPERQIPLTDSEKPSVARRYVPVPAIIAAVIASWIAGSAAQMSGALSGGEVSPALFFALLLFHQQVSVPVVLWATVPLVFVARLACRRLSTIQVATLTFGVTVVTFAISVVLYVVASLPGPLDGGNWAETLPRDIASLVAFHSVPWLVVFAALCSTRQLVDKRRQNGRTQPA